MCGRFGQAREPEEYWDYIGAEEIATEPLSPSWNVAPTDPVYAVRHRKGAIRLETMRWGMIPHWTPDLKTFHINARSETVAQNGLFRKSLANRRCLIPADGFYEWTARSEGHIPYWSYRSDRCPLAFAGLWSVRRHPATGEWLVSCAIITGESQGPISAVHHRMPIALMPQYWDPWLDPNLDDPLTAQTLLISPDTAGWAIHPVSRRVNKVANNDPSLIEPVTFPAAPTLLG
ncbi:MAG: SOS response-associated peptidase [bacterium]|nr:SOS response-associated peptidase [bacterium]